MIQDFFTSHSYLIGFVSFVLGLIGMPIVIRIAKAKGFVVRPNKRMSHTGEVPNIGGLNIYFSFMLTYLLFEYDQFNQSQFFLIGLLAIMAVGFIDDVLILTPTAKLLGETLAGIALVGFADAWHPYIQNLPRLISPSHELPQNVLPDAKIIIAYYVPFTKDLAKTNRTEGILASPEWARAYEETNALLATYLGRAAQCRERARCYAYMAAGGLLWSNWCVYKEQLGETFGSYAARQYAYARLCPAWVREEETSCSQ